MDPYVASSDLIFEIFSRVPLRTLATCRLLSKEFDSLTYESSFMRAHCQRTKTLAGYFVQSLENNRYHPTFLSIDNPGLVRDQLSLDFLPEPVQILATVDEGLMFCLSQGLQKHHYICKPGTRQWETIPNPNLQSFTRKIGMIVLGSDPFRFKIVRLSQLEHKYSEPELDGYKRYQCEIFNSENWAWKQLKDVILTYDEFFNPKHAISANAGLHWLTRNGNKNNILSFYEKKEDWELVSLPEPLCVRENWHSLNLAEYEGKVALICLRQDLDFVELWIVKDLYGEKQWSKKHTVNLIPVNKEIGSSLVDSFYNADILLLIGLYKAIFYNFKNGRFDSLQLEGKHKFPQSTFFVRTDYQQST